MNKKFVYGWWLPKEDQHFEDYFSKSIELKGRRVYQPDHLDRCIYHINQNGKKNSAIDIGAHCGFWSFFLGLSFKNVFSFEPVEIFGECFIKNVPHQNVKLIPIALGNENKFVSMNIDYENTGKTHISNQINESNKVELKKLDDYEFNNINFIKIDVEGFENHVVLGAKETLIRNKPTIIIEQKGLSSRFDDNQYEAIDTLTSFGAKIIEKVRNDYILSW